jgi:hypothetical protein
MYSCSFIAFCCYAICLYDSHEHMYLAQAGHKESCNLLRVKRDFAILQEGC